MENSVKVEKKERSSGIELLRIVALVLIFWMHASGSYENNEISAWISIFAGTIGNIGVSCFILVSGYFGMKFNAKKLIQLDLMLIFYCWIGLALQLLWGAELGGEEMLSYILPVIGKRSWYFTCYFALALLCPFLNELIEKLGQLRLRQLILTMLVIFSGVTTFFFFDINGDGGKGIVHMVMLYLIGRYIGLYLKEKEFKTGRLVGIFCAVLFVNFALNGALYVVTGTVQNRFARDNTLFTIAEAVCAFLLFRNLRFQSRAVNAVAKHVPAVFIMEWTLRGIVTSYLFDYLGWAHSDWYELLLLGIAVLLVLLGSLIDWVRVLLLGKLEGKIATSVSGILMRYIPRFF